METGRKNIALVFLIIAMLLIILLSSSLSQITFKPGKPFSLGELDVERIYQGLESGPKGFGQTFFLVIRRIYLVTLILLPVYILVNLLSPRGRTNLIADLIIILVILLFAVLLSENVQPFSTQSTRESSQSAVQTGLSRPAPLFDPNIPAWMEVLAAILLAVFVAVIVAFVLRWMHKRSEALKFRSKEKIADQVQEVIDALQAGKNIRQTVIRCYYQMSLYIEQQHGIQRKSAITPAEFEEQLIKQGFPPQPVQGLTRLFERVRYGNESLSLKEERQAVNSLQSIVDFCRDGVGSKDG